jgi:hypothetical protein
LTTLNGFKEDTLEMVQVLDKDPSGSLSMEETRRLSRMALAGVEGSLHFDEELLEKAKASLAQEQAEEKD